MRYTFAFGLMVMFVTSARAQAPLNYAHGPDSTSQALAMAGKPTGAIGDDSGCGCDECQKHGGLAGHHAGGRRNNSQRSVDWGNCNCNGSYKFPVPPLYTYQWPGRYSQQLMTDYHSPWRFPPLRPYVDEPVRGMNTQAVLPTSAETDLTVRSARIPAPEGEPESVSAKIERYYGVK